MFDATLQAISVEVHPQEDHVQVATVVGIAIPVAPGQAMPVPAGIFRVLMGKEAAIRHANELLDAAENLPDPQKPSGIVVANSLAGVDTAVKQQDQLTQRNG